MIEYLVDCESRRIAQIYSNISFITLQRQTRSICLQQHTNMINNIFSWLAEAPQLGGEPLCWNYLPSYAGWSLTVPKSEIRQDILGNVCKTLQLKITRRTSVQSNADRLAVFSALEDLAAWACENPPPNTRLKVIGLPEFTSRAGSGVEDISITLILSES